jgi:hypothetical protein
MKKLMRKFAHKRYIDKYLNELRWDSLNAILTASRTKWNDKVVALLDNNAQLIRKYERRRRWVKF